MKTEGFHTRPLSILNSERSHSQSRNQATLKDLNASLLTSENLRRKYGDFADKDSFCSVSVTGRGKRAKSRNISMKSSKGITKKSKTMDYTNYAYNEAVGRLKLMLADSYATPKASSSYMRSINDDSTDNFSDNMSVIERPVFADISKYLSPGYKSRITTSYRPKKPLYSTTISSSKENLSTATHYQPALPPPSAPLHTDYLMPSKPHIPTDSVQTPVEIFNFIEKQEDYIEQLEKESKYCRSELSHLLGKVKEVINENEQLTEHARSEFAAQGGKNTTSPSSDSEDTHYMAAKKKVSTSKMPATHGERKKDGSKSPRFSNAPSIVYEARISELEAELMQAQIDLKRVQSENDELKRKLANVDPVAALTGSSSHSSNMNCDAHRKQIEQLQHDKQTLEEAIRQLQKSLDEAKSSQYNHSSKRYVNDLLQMERSQSELEVKHLRDELDRQHERVRELQHEMARRIADERANAERRYNNQVDQLGGDLSNQWEQVAKLQLDLERQKRYETDLKRDLAQRNAQIDELKMELKSNRSTFLADMAQVSAERQSLEQEITALRLQLDRSARESKTEASRLNAEINSLRQRLDRGDADLLHSKREVLRLNDEIANLEKELAYGELKNEIRPTKKDLDKRISEMQDKHAETVNELEDMIQNQKQLMDKLTNECKILTNKLEDTTLKHNQDKQQLRATNEKLMERLKQIWASYKELNVRLDATHRPSPVSSLSDVEFVGEEHFASVATPSLEKPLSTTSRPRLLPPPDPPPTMSTNLHPTAMSPSWVRPLRPTYCPQQQQQQQNLQQQQATTITTNQNMNRQALHQQQAAQITTTKLATATTTMLESAKTTMRISRTRWEWVKNNNNSNNNNSATAIKIQPTSTPTPPQEPIPSSVTSSLPMTQSRTTASIQAMVLQPNNSQHSIPIWVPATTTTITAPMPTTISSSTMRAPTIPTTIHSSTIRNNNTAAIKSTTSAGSKAAMKAIAQPIMSRQQLPISTNQQQSLSQQEQRHRQQQQHPQQQQQYPQQQQQLQQTLLQQKKNRSRSQTHCQQHHQQQQQQQQRHSRRHLVAPESPRTLLAAQQQRAAHNLERAAALWGQQLQVEQNPLCRNSLPRQQPKSSFTMERFADNALGQDAGLDVAAFGDGMVDPFELEFSISSPSLMRSCGSDMSSDIEFDSISDMSVSPAQTAIRRIMPEDDEEEVTTAATTTKKIVSETAETQDKEVNK